jgi:hypothetical protein
MPHPVIHLGPCPTHPPAGPAEGDTVTLSGTRYHRIRNVDAMPPFLMSIVSASDLWMFVSSNGGLTAGRVDADTALFPYTTDDKVRDSAEHTGPKSVLLVRRGERLSLWEPFSERGRGAYRIERHLLKSVLGDEVVFEEHNRDLGLTLRYAWSSGDAFGFVRSATLEETLGEACSVELLDGLQHLVPSGVSAAMQGGMSNLVDAYKRAELEPETGLGLFALSSIISDLAEPSEALRATVVFATGFARDELRLLSSGQVDVFRRGQRLTPEGDVRGKRGAYFVKSAFALAPAERRRWRLVADVARDHGHIAALLATLRAATAEELDERIDADLRQSRDALAELVARADGCQWTADSAAADHHLASALFNLMRGGVVESYQVARDDLTAFVGVRNQGVRTRHAPFFADLPEALPYAELVERAERSGSTDLERLCRSYLPLAFSRRHGDPSRPWNRFAINVRHADGSPRLDYQGNWRDIFQNWEALAHAFPGYVGGMITLFLGATTADGYNPYRVTRDGIEWEVPEQGHAWANIGYWSDHQIVYLQRLLELAERFDPGAIDGLLTRRIFSHANVPYRIAPFEKMLDDPYDTITFDAALDRRIVAAVPREGTDARLLKGPDGAVAHVSMVEKLLLLVLVKLSNLVPGGGIWMNTQRPEWNDANNALVGKGLSVVTTAYLHRMVLHLSELLQTVETIELSRELADFLAAVEGGLRAHEEALVGPFDPVRRRAFMETLGRAGSAYRQGLYAEGLSGAQREVDGATLASFLELARTYLAHTLRANRRDDALYHAYNVLALEEGRARVRHLDEMLEGQVAVLSSGLLSAEEALELLASLRRSRLYRPDQHSYLLYPDRDLPGFLARNRIPPERALRTPLLAALLAAGDRRVVLRDIEGVIRFQAGFRNSKGVRRALDELAREERWATLVAADGDAVAALYEDVFDHASFTGRSGTFFAYEGLGSIYWHMVAKLVLAVAETHRTASVAGEGAEVLDALAAAFADLADGLGYRKSPAVFGAFPTDPYSHTPAHAGAQQPGMTGQVKEDLLARWHELGVVIEGGRLGFAPALLRRDEFLTEALDTVALTPSGPVPLALGGGSLAFTVCQVPVVYHLVDGAPNGAANVVVQRPDGSELAFDGPFLDTATSREVFARSGAVRRIAVAVPVGALRGGGPRVRQDVVASRPSDAEPVGVTSGGSS